MGILIKNATIITLNNDNPLIDDGFVYIDGPLIKHVGLMRDISSFNLNEDEVIDAKDFIVMPGFANCHTHSPMTLLRNYGSDLNLQDWLFNKIFPKEAMLTDEDIYYGSMLAIAEMIETGTCSFADMYYKMDNIARAVSETGIRSNISIGPFSNTFVNDKKITEKDFATVERFVENWDGKADGRIKVSLEVHSTYLFDINVLPDAVSYAKENNLGIHIHLHETLTEVMDSLNEHGKNPIQICYDIGMLDLPILAAHCVHLTDDDIKLLKECSKFTVVHNPTSNLKLASGIARIPDLINAGVNVALGTDGCSSNNNLNMIEEMHIAAILHKGITKDPKVIDAKTALTMATTNGCKALGFENLGTIDEGMLADIILIDINNLHHFPINDPIASIAYSTQGSDVDTVIINGNVVYKNKEFKTIDIEKVKYAFNNCCNRLFNE